MTIEERLYALLSGPVVDQISEVSAPQGTPTPYTVFFRVTPLPIETQQAAYVQSLRMWEFQFTSYATSPLLARAETKKIVDYLTTFQDAGIRVCFLKPSGGVQWDGDAQLFHSIAEFEIIEALG